MNLADRIQQLRKRKGISQEELADRIGVSRQAVSKWESGQTSPDLEKIVLLSDYFEVTTDYLLKGTQIASSQRVRPEWENSASEDGQPNVRKSDARKLDAQIFTMAGSALNLIGRDDLV